MIKIQYVRVIFLENRFANTVDYFKTNHFRKMYELSQLAFDKNLCYIEDFN